MAQVTFVKPSGRDLSGPFSSISKSIQQMPWTGELVVGVLNGGGQAKLRIGPNDPSMAAVEDVGTASNVRWLQLVARRAGNVMVEARSSNNSVLDYFQLVIKDAPRLPSSSTTMEFEFEADDPAKPGQINFKAYSPANDANYIDKRMEAVGYGIYLFGCHVYCTELPMPIYVADTYIDFKLSNAVPINTAIYPDFSAAQAAIQAAPAATNGATRYAFYRGAGGPVIVPTVFSPATTPRTIETLRTARTLLADEVQKELSVLALSMIGGFVLKTILTRKVRAGQKKAEPLASEPPRLRVHPSMNRLQNTAQNLQGKNVVRSAEVLTQPRTYRHTVTGDIPPVNYARIEQEGSLRLSTGSKAHYGEGVYAWPKGQDKIGTYIDIEVPAGTGVETLTVNGQTWVRMVPPTGNRLPVRIVGTNMPQSQIDMGRKLIAP